MKFFCIFYTKKIFLPQFMRKQFLPRKEKNTSEQLITKIIQTYDSDKRAVLLKGAAIQKHFGQHGATDGTTFHSQIQKKEYRLQSVALYRNVNQIRVALTQKAKLLFVLKNVVFSLIRSALMLRTKFSSLTAYYSQNQLTTLFDNYSLHLWVKKRQHQKIT